MPPERHEASSEAHGWSEAIVSILMDAIARGDTHALNGYAMRYFAKRQEWIKASTCREVVKSWKTEEFWLEEEAQAIAGDGKGAKL